MKKDDRIPDRKYIFPNEKMVDEEEKRKSQDVKAQPGPSIDKKDGEKDND